MRAVVTFLQEALRIRPEEMKRTALAFLYLFSTIGAFITARITTSSLFLEIPNYREQLPLTYIGIAITVSLVMSRYAKVERRLRRDITNTISLVGIILVTLGFRGLLAFDFAGGGMILDNARHEVYWAFLIWAEVLGAMLIVQFWSLIPEVFNSRQAKRLFALIGGGGVMANIFFGQVVRRSVGTIGTENLLFIIVACLILSAVAVQALGRNARAELVAAKERAPTKKKVKVEFGGEMLEVFNTRHVQLIALVVIVTYLVSAMVDYQFKVIVGDFIPGKDSRSAYFADFFTYTGIIAAVIQFTLTSRILERFGVLVALLLLPIFMLGGTTTVVFAFLPALWAAAATKGSENVLRYTVNDSTLQLLYLPVPSSLRGRAKAVIDGILKPLSMGVAGFLTALLVGSLDTIAGNPAGTFLGFTLSVFQLGWIVGAALLCWAVALIFLRREYLHSLLNTLHRRRLNFEEAGFQINDEATIKTLQSALSSENVGYVLHALELMPHVTRKAREPLNDQVVKLVMHEADEVRVAALKYLSSNSTEDRAEVRELLDDSSRDVRAAAILAYCATRREKSIERVHELLQDCDRKAQAAAVAGLIRYGGLDGVLACADLLKLWLNSEDPLDRRHAAWVLGEVGVQNFYQPLIPLLADDSERVRQEAISAAGKLRNRELLGPLIEQLRRPSSSGTAVQVLATFGSEIEDTIAEVLSDDERATAARINACKVLSRLGDKHSAEILCEHIRAEDPHIRASAVAALSGIVYRLPGMQLDRAGIDRAIIAEAKRWFLLLALTLDLRLGDEAVLLADALKHRRGMAQTQILALLGLKYSRETIELVANNLQSKQANARANAVEVLDNLLDKEEKACIIPLLDDAPEERKLAAVADEFEIVRRSRQARLGELLEHGDPWLRTCAATEVGARKLSTLEPKVRALLDNESAVNRETAIVALRQLLGPEELERRVRPLVDDPVAHVRRYAQHTLAHAAG